MIAAQLPKVAKALAPVSSTGAYTFTAVPCTGYHYALVVFGTGVITTNDFAATFEVKYSYDDSTYTSFPAGAILDNSSGFATQTSKVAITLPTASDGGLVWMCAIDLRKIPQDTGTNATNLWIKPAASAGAGGALAACYVLLFDGDVGVKNYADAGCKERVLF